MSKNTNNPGYSGLETAIIGMAGRFPGANNINDFWNNLKNGVESVTFFSKEELLADGVPGEIIDDPSYVKAYAKVEGKEYFDSSFFGYVPDEAGIMDPQMRIFHECVWEALEDAGYNPDSYEGLIGLYAGAGVGIGWETYAILIGHETSIDSFTAGQLRNRDYLTTRISYKLNLKGPAVFIQTACSTSLVAIHMACRGLLTGETNIALAGGVTLNNTFKSVYYYQEGMVLSPDGHCRAFDKEAKGTVGAEGAAVVVLKQLKHAIADRDNIWAVIKGTAINNDGFRKVGFTAPSTDGQAEVIRMALKMSRVEPQSIGYIETHGTATQLGDLIEIEALTHVFGGGGNKEKNCAIGSVKSNIGHLDAAAGVASVIKTVLALKYKQIPPSLHFKTPNPQIDFANSPFYVNTGLREWKKGEYPLRAGVSSFGIGGTNAHVILEEAPELETTEETREYKLIMFSAKTAGALERMISNYKSFLQENREINPADTAYTLQIGRQGFSQRGMFVCKDIREAIEILSNPETGKIKRYTVNKKTRNAVFMFSGQGTYYVNMGLEIYRTESVFRREMDRCFDIIKPIIGYDLKEILYPGAGKEDPEKLNHTSVSQPVLFIFEYSLAKMLMEWGIKPTAMIGYSTGEYVAASIAGVFLLEDALRLVSQRGIMMEEAPLGAMLSVPLTEKELIPILESNEALSLAVDNGASCIVSGTQEAVEVFEKEMKLRRLLCMRLNLTHAAHSHVMGPILKRFESKVREVKLEKPTIRYVSTQTGTWIKDEEAVSPEFWAEHIRSAVRFSQGMGELLNEENSIYIEIGPGKALSNFVRQHPGKKEGQLVVNIIRDRNEDVSDAYYLMDRLGRMWLYGQEINWKGYYRDERRKKISLPTYPFEKIEYVAGVDVVKMISGLMGDGKRSIFEHKKKEEVVRETEKPQFRSERSEMVTPYIEPVTTTEKALVAIWENFFGVEKVGILDDFFELGGDSLKAMTLSGKIHHLFEVEMHVVDFFSHPAIKDMAGYIDTAVRKEFTHIPKAEKKEYYPLSSAQRRLYFIQKMTPGSVAYNLPISIPLGSEMDKERLEQIFNRSIQRHESFRTSFEMVGMEPAQRIHDTVEFNIENFELTKMKTFVRPFDLSKAPLLRVAIVDTGIGTRQLLVDMSHIISDGVSMTVLEKEFIALSAGKELPGLEIQYKDYSQWQNGDGQQKAIKNQEQYWLEKYSDELPVLELPYDYQRPSVQSFEGSAAVFGIEKKKVDRLKEIASANDTTLFMALLAAYFVFLSKLSGQEDIVVGIPVAGRRHADLQQIMGMFVNTLSIRNYPNGEMSFIDFLKEVRENTLSAYENQDYPFEDLVEKVKIERNAGRNPIFDVVFNMLNQAEFKGEYPGLDGEESYTHTPGVSKFDLNLYFIEIEAGRGLIFNVEYCAVLFKAKTIERFIGYFKRVLTIIMENPEIKVREIELQSEAERSRFLSEANRKDEVYSTGETLHGMFEGQVERAPDHIAIVSSSIQITYHELNEKSNRLAFALQEKGVRGGDIVGIQVERSVEMIVGILGILKSGAAYMPINPKNPEERTRYMMEDSSAKIIISDHMPPAARNLFEKRFLDLQKLLVNERNQLACPVNPLTLKTNTNTCYIIYTSGSTGKHKGVPITHSNVSPLMHWGQKNLGIGAKDWVINNLAYYFDWSVWEIFITLTTGAGLHFVSNEMLLDPGASIDYIQTHGITALHVTPTQYGYFVNEKQKIESLKYLFIGAEKLTYDLVKRSIESVTEDCRVFNMYGPTEATIISAVLEIHKSDVEKYKESGSVPIGWGVGNLEMVVLDKYLKTCPVGITGELYIFGAGVARGYLNNPELTAERFINNPKPKTQNSKLYRTGDIVKWLPDGNIEFLGRIDHQVKIRGNRIELGEIENRLLKYESVRDAIVLERESGNGEKYLCAYVVGVDELELSTGIREYLSRELPDYMIPSHFIGLEKIPLNPNGKVDRKALVEMAPVGEIEIEAPVDELEKTVSRIWAEVLGINAETIGSGTSFFQLGGHSLNAVTVIAKIHKALDVNVSLAELFKTPTIKGLAEHIKGLAEEKYQALEPVEEKEYYPVSSAQRRLFILQAMLGENIVYNMPQQLSLGKEIDIENLDLIFKQIIQRHEGLRTSFHLIDNEPVQRIHDNVEFKMGNFDLATEDTESTEERIRLFVRPFDLSKPPLIHAAIVKTGNETYQLLIDKHHIISDAVSEEVLANDFISLHKGLELTPLRIQYKDFSEWRRSAKEKERIKKQEAYWESEIGGEIPVLKLPTDYSRPVMQDFEGQTIGFFLDEENIRRLKKQAPRQSTTLYMVMLTLFYVLLNKLTGTEEIIVGTPTAGRGQIELQQIIGMFVNTLVLKNYPNGEKTVKQLLEEVKERTLAAFENQEYPFEDLVERLVLKRDAGRNPLFDVMFTYRNPGIDENEEIGIHESREMVDSINRVSKFDITLTVLEMGSRIMLSFEYSTKLFKQETIRRFADYYKRIITGFIREPGQKISEVEFISEYEKKQILFEFNQTAAEYPGEKTVHELFEEQVEKTPGHIAVIGPTVQITYRELNEKSDRLAQQLGEERVGPDIIVGIKVERSIEMIVGILGILKAGGVYLPIDPDYPQERVDYMLKDSDAKLLITTDNLKEFPNFLTSQLPNFHLLPATGNRQPATSLAYIIYTSGSTGKPKGTPIEHRNVVRLMVNDRFQFDFTTRDIWTMFHSYCFDFSVWEMYGALLYGGKLVIIPRMTARDTGMFLGILRKYGVTVLNQTPSAFYNLMNLELSSLVKCLSLRYVIFGGEALNLGRLKDWKAIYPGTKLINMYGITETTVHVTFKEIGDRDIDVGVSNIGKAIPTLTIYVMDKNIKLLPVGIPGELIVGGDGVARGYLNNPELTNERFIQMNSGQAFNNNPKPKTQNSKLYRTGDLARWMKDGNIEFLGRIDTQVKIRGYRIELGEIRGQLLKHNEIQDAVVVVSEDKQESDRYLCAYIVSRNELSAPALREYLLINLPDYMIPAYFVRIEKIPLTPNGKLNHAALPPPGVQVNPEEYITPGDEVEEELVKIWSEILGIESGRISMNANFFELGGHSLRVTLMVGEIFKKFDVDISIADIFKAPTIRNISSLIKAIYWGKNQQPMKKTELEEIII